MGYTLEALLWAGATPPAMPAGLRSLSVVHLWNHIYLIPLTETAYDAINIWSKHDGAKPYAEFWALSLQVARLAQHLSRTTVTGYIEAEYFGGVGQQASIAWFNEQVSYGPLKAPNAINQVLRYLHVTANPAQDEFDTVGLGRYRDTEEWGSAASPS